MRVQEMFLDAGADPSLFLHAPGEVMKAEGVDGLSRAGARELRASESTQLLRSLVDEEARRHGERITLDVFASGDNAVVPRFFARHAEPAAEGVDAFAQPSWAVSLCPAGRVGVDIGSSRSFFRRGPCCTPRSPNSVPTGCGV